MVGSDDDDDDDESCPPPLVDSSEAASGDGSSGASEAASDEAWLADASRLEVVMRRIQSRRNEVMRRLFITWRARTISS